MENLELNGYIAGGVAMAAVFRVTCVVGKSMLMPVKAIEAMGGFAAVRNVLGEDQVFGIRVRQAGYSLRLSHHVIENINCRRSFRWFLNRHSRWNKIRRRLALPAFLLEPAANLACVGLVWAFSGESGIAWGGLLLLVGLGMARDAFQTRWMRGSFPKLRHLVFSPVKDILLLPVWFDAILNRRVNWRGHLFTIGRLTRLREIDSSSREVRRRARRVRKIRARHDHSQ
jgi:ceramide glucosyltransferase